MQSAINEDWLKVGTWDLWRGKRLVENVPDLLWALKVADTGISQQVAAVEAMTRRPAWRAAPPDLVNAVTLWLKEQRTTKAMAYGDHYSHEIRDRIVRYYRPKIEAALRGSIRGTAGAAAAARAKIPIERGMTKAVAPDIAAIARQAILNHVGLSNDGVLKVMKQMIADTALAAAHAAADTVGADAAMPEGFADVVERINWDTWKPGWAEAHDLTELGGLRSMLGDADVTIQGMSDTAMDYIERTLANGLANGDPVTVMARDMDSVVGDPARAYLIAETETSRAMTETTISTFAANDVAQWEWLSEDDDRVCGLKKDDGTDEGLNCLDLNGQQFEVGGDDPRPPLHPRCRCIVLAVVEELTQEDLDAAGYGSTDQSDQEDQTTDEGVQSEDDQEEPEE